MTSIEWLIDQLQAPCRGIPSHIIEQAKEMHKAEQEKLVDEALTNYEIGWADRKAQLPQQEISDEEIEKGAKEWYNKEGAYSASAIALKTWVYAIRWYREQLKSK